MRKLYYTIWVNPPFTMDVLQGLFKQGYQLCNSYDNNPYTFPVQREQQEDFEAQIANFMELTKVRRIQQWGESFVRHCDVCGFSQVLLPNELTSAIIPIHCEQPMRSYLGLTPEDIEQIIQEKTLILFFSFGGWLDRGWHEAFLSFIDEESDCIKVTSGSCEAMVSFGYEVQTFLRQK